MFIFELPKSPTTRQEVPQDDEITASGWLKAAGTLLDEGVIMPSCTSAAPSQQKADILNPVLTNTVGDAQKETGSAAKKDANSA